MKTYLKKILFICSFLFTFTSLQASCQPNNPVVLFDQHHGQLFSTSRTDDFGLSKFHQLFNNQEYLTKIRMGEITPSSLSGIDSLVVSGPFKPFSPGEIKAILNFLSRGGKLALMLHIATPAINLLHNLGVAVSNGVILEQEHQIGQKSLDFQVTRLAPHPLNTHLDHFSLFGTWALFPLNKEVAIIAKTSPHAWIDLNQNGKFEHGDAMQQFAVVVTGSFGTGKFVVFGDDAIFQNRYLTGSNLKLANNLVHWLGNTIMNPWVSNPENGLSFALIKKMPIGSALLNREQN